MATEYACTALARIRPRDDRVFHDVQTASSRRCRVMLVVPRNRLADDTTFRRSKHLTDLRSRKWSLEQRSKLASRDPPLIFRTVYVSNLLSMSSCNNNDLIP